MESLSDDSLLYIFSFLDARTLSSVSLVCRRWCEVSNSNFLWKSLVKRVCSERSRAFHLGRADSWKLRYAQIVAGRLYPRVTSSGKETPVPFEALRESLSPVEEGTCIQLDVPRYLSKSRLTIRDFVESCGHVYIVGKAFYQHTKSETISIKKKIILECRETGKLYAGSCVRKMLGLTKNVSEWNIHPSTLDNRVTQEFHVFVQSTSVNRVLVRNTKLLLVPT